MVGCFVKQKIEKTLAGLSLLSCLLEIISKKYGRKASFLRYKEIKVKDGLGYSFEIKGNFMPEDELPGVASIIEDIVFYCIQHNLLFFL